MIKDVILAKTDAPEDILADIPVYFNPVDNLSELEKEQLVKEIKEELDAIKEERDELGLDEKFDSLDRQYGEGSENGTDTMFDFHSAMTKVKCKAIASDIHQATVNVDPKISVSPRPEYAREGGKEVCDKQQDFLDYELDSSNHELDRINRLIELSAVVKGVGIKKKFHQIETRRRIRKEKYTGTPEIIGIDEATGENIMRNKGLEEFLNKYPDALTDYKNYVKLLSEGRTIHLDAQYTEMIKNKPVDSYVDPKNFYVRKDVKGYEGLCNTRLTAERIPFFWWELKNEETKGYFFDINKLKTSLNKETNQIEDREGYREETYNILLCVYQWYMKDDDEYPTKVLAWIDEDSDTLIGVMLYPYDGVDCFYIQYYVKIENDGFYQPGVAEDLTQLNEIENNLYNFGLEGMVLSNTFTPILKEGDPLEDQFLNKEFTHGVPLISRNPEQVFSLQSFMKPTSLQEVIASLHLVSRQADDVSRFSSLKTGAENPLDPNAPATKTLALMRQTDKNIRDYIECMVPSYNIDAWMTLQMYAQIDREGGIPFKLKTEKVTGSDPFSTITRSEMVARTNIQSRAMSFDFDKSAEKREDLALLQILLQQYMVAKRPESIHLLLKNIIKGWSPKWRNLVDSILPTLQQLKQEEMTLAAQGIAVYVAKTMEDSKLSGNPMQIDPNQLLQIAKQFAEQATTPPPKDKK